MKQTDRLALLDWEKYKEDIARATPVDRNMTAAEREKHREYLEKHPIEWIKFFFPNYVKYEFADFQKKAIRRIIAHDEWFEVLSWSRELAKSTVTMFIVMNLTLTGRKKNVILTSNSKDNAVRLLDPYRANLEANGRIMAYYGKQELPGSWTEDEFTTKGKVSFRALGAGQSPRGSRNEAIRPDVLLVDDFDTDEDTKNPDIIQKRWDWWENASVSHKVHFRTYTGHLLRKHHRQGLLRGEGGRNGRLLGHREHPRQKRFFHMAGKELGRGHRPHTVQNIQKGGTGRIFQQPDFRGRGIRKHCIRQVGTLQIQVPRGVWLRHWPKAKGKKGKSFKTVSLCGKLGGRLYASSKTFLAQALNAEFIDWYVRMLEFVGGKTNVYCYMESNKLDTLSSNRCSKLAGGKSTPRTEDCAVHPGRRGEEDGQGDLHPGQP